MSQGNHLCGCVHRQFSCADRGPWVSQTAFLLRSAAGRSDSIVWQARASLLWKGLSRMEEENWQTADQTQGMDREGVHPS